MYTIAKEILFTSIKFVIINKKTAVAQSFTKGKKFKPTDIFTDKAKNMY